MKSSYFNTAVVSGLILLCLPALLSPSDGMTMVAGFGAPKVLSGTPDRGMRDITFYGNYGICRSAAGIVILKMHTGDSSEFVTEVALGSPLSSPPIGHFRPKVAGSVVYVPDWDEGFWIVDLTDPQSPMVVGGAAIAAPDYCKELVVLGDYLFVGGIGMTGLITFDVTDPIDPVLMSTHPVLLDVLDMTVRNNHLYAAGYHTFTYSLAQPDAPVLLEENTSTGRAYGIRAADHFVYVADLQKPFLGGGCLAVFSRSDTTTPVLLGREANLDGHEDVDVELLGSRAIVLSLEGLLHMVDVSDPMSPQRLYSYDTPTPCPEGMTLQREFLYVVGQTAGVYAFRLLNRGDANSDGSYSAADVIWLVNYIFRSGPPPTPLEQGDCNCDGQYNSADLIYLVNFIFKGGPPPFC